MAPTRHRFWYRMFMLYIDLAELPQLFDRVPFWSARRAAFGRFRRSDYLGAADIPLDRAVRDLVEAQGLPRPTGPIRLLTHLRYFGHCFNPVSFYYCFDDAGAEVRTIVAEITNTPWKERHQYVLSAPVMDGKLKRFSFEKRFHVSPFLPMDMTYLWRFGEPGEHLFVHMQNLSGAKLEFDATLRLDAKPWSAAALVGLLFAYPLMTFKVVAAIHWQALRLWLKKTPLYDHPAVSPR